MISGSSSAINILIGLVSIGIISPKVSLNRDI